MIYLLLDNFLFFRDRRIRIAVVLSIHFKITHMKKIFLFILFAAFISTAVSAQITRATTTTKTDTSKMQTLKTTAPNTYVKPQADLRITALTFTHVKTELVNGVATHTFQINYSVKNEGNLAVSAGNVLLQGFIHHTPPPTTGGCGRVVGERNGDMINPGATISGWFRCTSAFDRNNPPVYRLWIDSEHLVKESNEDNNMAQSTLIF